MCERFYSSRIQFHMGIDRCGRFSPHTHVETSTNEPNMVQQLIQWDA